MPARRTATLSVNHKQAPFDDLAGDIPVAAEQERDEIEPHAASDKRKQHEKPEIISGKARRDRDKLVRNGGHALEQDDQAAPARIALAERLDLVAEAID